MFAGVEHGRGDHVRRTWLARLRENADRACAFDLLGRPYAQQAAPFTTANRVTVLDCGLAIAIKISMTAVTLFGSFLSIYATPSSMLYRRRPAQRTAIYG